MKTNLIYRLELENIEFKKELKLWRDYMREVDKTVIYTKTQNCTTVCSDPDEVIDFKQYKEQYNQRVHQIIQSQDILPWENISTQVSVHQNTEDKPSLHHDYLFILNENDWLKREIYQFEVENQVLQSKSNLNKELIDELSNKLQQIIKEKENRYQQLKSLKSIKSLSNQVKINLGDNTTNNLNAEECLLTKRSSAATDRIYFHHANAAKHQNENYKFRADQEYEWSNK